MKATLLLQLEDRAPVFVTACHDPEQIGKTLPGGQLYQWPRVDLLLNIDCALTVELNAIHAEEDPQTAKEEGR